MRAVKATRWVLTVLAVLLAFSTPAAVTQAPKRGGILNLVTSDEPVRGHSPGAQSGNPSARHQGNTAPT